MQIFLHLKITTCRDGVLVSGLMRVRNSVSSLGPRSIVLLAVSVPRAVLKFAKAKPLFAWVFQSIGMYTSIASHRIASQPL